MILIEGNAAAAIGCMMAGVTFVGWYPITPSSSLCESLIDYLKKYRKDPETGKATYAVIQAEDEIAALGMVIGAGWMGARAMTSTAGPGISLMGEFTGLGYYAEVPAVIFDVQRVRPLDGPADAHRAAGHPVDGRAVARRHEAPAAAPGIGDRVLHDGHGRLRPGRAAADADLRDVGPRPRHEQLDGAAVRVPDQAARPRQAARRRDARSASASWAATGTWTATAFPYRTVPGDGMPAYFTRGSGHNEKAQYSERADDYANNLDRLARKFETARTLVPKPEVEMPAEGADRPHRLRDDALGHRRIARPAEERGTASRRRTCGSAPIRSRPRSSSSSTRATASTSSSRTATRRCCRCSRWSARRRSSPSFAASVTTSGCRSTAAR